MTGKATILDWKAMAEGPEKYAAYLASPEWAVKKIAVRKRSGGICEWCKHDPATEVHHQTYLRKYNEPLTDLLDVCRPCHAFKSGRSKEDPREYWKSLEPRPVYRFVNLFPDPTIQCPECRSGLDYVHIEGPTVASRHYSDPSIIIPFWCECGCYFNWELYTHKGPTYVTVSITGHGHGEPK